MTTAENSHGLDSAPYRLPASNLIVLAFCTLVVAACVVIEIADLAPILPPLLRGTLGASLFLTVPGFIILSYIGLLQSHEFSGLTLFVLSTSLSMTANFLGNLAVFAFNPLLSVSYTFYLASLAALYALFWMLLAYRDASVGARLLDAVRSRPTSFAIVVIGVLLLIALASLKKNPGILIEELFILRKMADLGRIAADNLSHVPDSVTTYYFVPFYLYLGLLSEFTRTDVIGAMFEGTPYLTLVVFCIHLRLFLMFATGRALALGFSLIFAIYLLSFDLWTGNYFSLLVPSIDRYTIATVLLVPLAMFHFLIHTHDERVNIAMLVGLIYLLIEMSFVHAREALYFLGFAITYIILSLSKPSSWTVVRRGTFVIVIVISALLLYKHFVLAENAELQSFVADMSSTMWEGLLGILASGNINALLGIERMEGYQLFSGRLDWIAVFGPAGLPIVCFLLPIYALMANSVLRMALATTTALILLFSANVGIKLLVGAVVGSWFIFDLASFMALLLLLVFVDFFQRLSELDWRLSELRRLLSQRRGQIALGLVALAVGLTVLTLAEWPDGARQPFHPRALYSLLLLTAGAILWRLPSISAAEPLPARSTGQALGCWALAACLASVPLGSEARNWFPETAGSRWCSSEDPIAAYACMNEQRLVHVLESASDRGRAPAPDELLTFVRDQIPVGKVWFGTDTLPITATLPHYSPVPTYASGSLSVYVEPGTTGYSYMAPFWDGSIYPPLRVSDYLATNEGRKLLLFALEDSGSEYLIVGPSDYAATLAGLPSAPEIERRLTTLYDRDGYLIYRVAE